MINKIKSRLEKELGRFPQHINNKYRIKGLSPKIYESIKDYILSNGKRLRPILFILGYKAYAKKNAKNLYLSAIAVELIHDFILIHDDIIDKADLRRGMPSLHERYNSLLPKNKKTTGQDIALVIGDILFALSISTYLSIDVDKKLKEKGLNKMMDTAAMTGYGQVLELLTAMKTIDEVKEKDILKICDLKTALYTFCAPLEIGAVLAGANKNEISKLHDFGLNLGRAFQLKDDILGLYGNTKETGKPSLTDIQESKKTLLIYTAYKKASKKDRATIKKMLAKNKVTLKDLRIIQGIIKDTSSLNYTLNKIIDLQLNAIERLETTSMKEPVKVSLMNYMNDLLKVKGE